MVACWAVPEASWTALVASWDVLLAELPRLCQQMVLMGQDMASSYESFQIGPQGSLCQNVVTYAGTQTHSLCGKTIKHTICSCGKTIRHVTSRNASKHDTFVDAGHSALMRLWSENLHAYNKACKPLRAGRSALRAMLAQNCCVRLFAARRGKALAEYIGP